MLSLHQSLGFGSQHRQVLLDGRLLEQVQLTVNANNNKPDQSSLEADDDCIAGAMVREHSREGLADGQGFGLWVLLVE